MAIKTGRFGLVKWDPAGVTSPLNVTTIASLNAWKLSLKTAKEDVTCFQDTNKVYVPGMMDISGTLSGFFNASELALVKASAAATPGELELGNNSSGDPTVLFHGLAYMDCDIDCSLSAPKISGSFVAAGPWVLPS